MTDVATADRDGFSRRTSGSAPCLPRPPGCPSDRYAPPRPVTRQPLPPRAGRRWCSGGRAGCGPGREQRNDEESEGEPRHTSPSWVWATSGSPTRLTNSSPDFFATSVAPRPPATMTTSTPHRRETRANGHQPPARGGQGHQHHGPMDDERVHGQPRNAVEDVRPRANWVACGRPIRPGLPRGRAAVGRGSPT